jgi:hypothetical protein
MKQIWKMWLWVLAATACNATRPAAAGDHPWEGTWIEVEQNCNEKKNRVFK